MTVGKKIRKIRQERGLTQKQLGQLCAISESTVRKYELELLNPKTKTIRKFASALGISEYELQGITADDILNSLSDTASFFNYLHANGYEVHESLHNDKWVIHVKDSDTDIYISKEEMDALERTTKENIDLRINYYLHDGKHHD